MNKRISTLLLTVVMLISLVMPAAPVSADPVANGLGVSSSSVAPGEEFTVTLTVPAISTLMATVQFDVSYDKTVFKLTSVNVPAWVGEEGKMSSTPVEANARGMFTTLATGAGGDNKINFSSGMTMTMTFEALSGAAVGDSNITISQYLAQALGSDGYTPIDCKPVGVVETATVSVTAPGTKSISLSQTTAKDFGSAVVGYAAITPATITVTNSGTDATGALTVGLSGADSSAFELNKTSIPSIAVSGSDTFTVKPKAGLAAKTYNATVTVSGTGITSRTFNVTFAVNAGTKSINLSQTTAKDFGSEIVGYAAITPATITVTNSGTAETGALTVGLSGAGSSAFELNRTSISSIAVSGSDTFTVKPKTGLTEGTYNATVTVSGTGITSKTFNVSFAVSATPTYGISLSRTAPYSFTAKTFGYTSVTPLNVTVSNTGNQATGNLTVALSGLNYSNFELSSASIASIAAGGSGSFSVEPRMGLAAGTHTATVTVSGGANITAQSFDISFTVNPAPTYGITLSQTGTKVISGETVGYTSASSADVTVTNNGNQATGTLSVQLSGTNSSAFDLSKTSITSIAAGATDSFSVTPKTGLGVGTYTATVTVRGGSNITAQSFDISFTVNQVTSYGISLSQSGTKTFSPATVGYAAQNPFSVTVRNTGTVPTGDLTIALSGTDSTSFTLNKDAITSIAANGSNSFTVVPNTNLSVGTYNATVTVSGTSNIVPKSFDVAFTVRAAPVYSISLSQTTPYVFANQTFGYTSVSPLSVTVTNNGNQSTGNLYAALSGTNQSSFEITGAMMASMQANGTRSFSVKPKTGLAVGTYTATVTVSGGSNITAQSFDISYTVDPVVSYGISLSQSGTKTFTSATVGYAAQTPFAVTVRNTGSVPTGDLTVALSGADSASFTLNSNTITSIAANGTDSFTVVPNTNLGVGTYNAVVTVSGANVTSKSFNVSFTVTAVPTYGITLSQTTPYSFTAQTFGYTSVTPLNVTVTNNGNQATGNLSVALSGNNNTSFELTATGIASITAGGTRSFSVRPKMGLAAGTYTATVTVSGGSNITAQSFDVSYTVNPVSTKSIALSVSGMNYFNNAIVGYTTAPTIPVTVTNNGTVDSGDMSIAISGTNASVFTTNVNAINNLTPSGTSSFTVAPLTGLAVGTYNATVTVSGTAGLAPRSFNVSFTVLASAADITSANALVTAPVAGQYPSYTATSAVPSKYGCTLLTWEDLTAGTTMTATTPFVAGHVYRANVSFMALSGYNFTTTAAYTINGFAATATAYPAVKTYSFVCSSNTGYTITTSAGAGGSISPAGTITVAAGANQTFYITPNSGYAVADIKVNGVSRGATTMFTINNINGNVTVEASFRYVGVYNPITPVYPLGNPVWGTTTSVITAPLTYSITSGNNAVWESNMANGLTFTCNGSLARFKNLKIDGKKVNKSYYTTKSGSTVLTLSPSYLKTLSEGEHKIVMLYSDGDATGKFTVNYVVDVAPDAGAEVSEETTAAPAVTEAVVTAPAAANPQTGNAPIALMLIPVALAAAAITVKKIK